ncbi:hypothetical protein TWF281_004520 [Arthrobotrys megalospora]
MRLEGGKLYPCHLDVEGDNDATYSSEGLNNLGDIPITNFNLRFFSGDAVVLPNSKTDGTKISLSSLVECIPSPIDYLDIGHPSIIWKTTLEEAPGIPPELVEGADTIIGLFQNLAVNANNRWVAKPQNGGEPVKLVKVIAEFHDYLTIGIEMLELKFATVAEDERVLRRVREVVRFVV